MRRYDGIYVDMKLIIFCPPDETDVSFVYVPPTPPGAWAVNKVKTILDLLKPCGR